jgi:Nucleotidyl transferase AbiEii toxin, Type IV TA system
MATPVESALRRAVADLNALKAQWALIGGLAISVRSVPRFTKDLDFATRTSPTLKALSPVRQQPTWMSPAVR